MARRESEPRCEGLCVGRPVSQVDLRLLRPCDEPIALGEDGWAPWDVPSGEVGEVTVTGTHVLAGYLNNPEADRENKIREGECVWHRTGDAARLDEEGRLWLMGRVKARVRRAGQLWWPIPAEVRALGVTGVTHAAYLGMPDAAMGQRAVLCVETPAGRLTATDRERLLTALAPMPVDELRAFRRLPRDPRHASKTDTEALRRRLPPPHSP